METVELIRLLGNEEFAIFGAGFVAERFYRALCRHGLQGQIRRCFVSRDSGGTFHGIAIQGLDEIEDCCDLVCCVAVHDALRGDVERALEGKFREVLWVYPHLWELIFGAPLRTQAVLPLKNILAEQRPEDAWIALRYALAESWESCEASPAEEIYRKAQRMFSGRETVEKRISRLSELHRSMRDVGFDERCPILIDGEYRIIDGLHRLALAALLGIEQIPCTVYEAKPWYDAFLGEENRLTDAVQERCMSGDERTFLAEAKRRMLARAGVRGGAPSVSVILPVYNVADYMDVCMQSLQRQTFRDFEMLLINDGSTDGSYERCLDWLRKDDRVRVFDRANGGVADARNFGLARARGEFIAFIDPDDWVEDTYLEKLRTALADTGADYAECDLWRYDNRTGKKIYRSCYGRMGVPYTLREHMKYGPTATYKAMSRRSLWMNNGVRMPDCAFESPAVYSLILALSNRVVNIREPLYYYRRFRENSLIETGYAGKDGSANNTLGVEAMEFLVGEFVRTGLYDEYKDTLEGVIKYRLSDILAMQFHRKAEEDFREVVRNYRSFLNRMFPAARGKPYITWGGYNLNRILSHMRVLHEPYTRFNFSSMVGVGNEDCPRLPELTHKNRYRELMVNRELSQQVWRVTAQEEPAYLFVDLLEERFDVLELDGRYLTISDAFEGCAGAAELLARGRRISRDSDECGQLWREGAQRFFRRMCAAIPQEHICILENYLCEQVGNLEERRNFPQLEEIRKYNRILREYYGFLRQLLPGARFLCFADDPLYFTDEKYEYGAVPSHLNELENQRIAEHLETAMFA